MTGFVLISFSGRVLVVQEVLRTVIIAPYRKAILVLCRFCKQMVYMCQQNTTKIRPERGIQLFGQSYQKITMDLVGEIKSE
jgi:hypothetical protein